MGGWGGGGGGPWHPEADSCRKLRIMSGEGGVLRGMLKYSIVIFSISYILCVDQR